MTVCLDYFVNLHASTAPMMAGAQRDNFLCTGINGLLGKTEGAKSGVETGTGAAADTLANISMVQWSNTRVPLPI